MYHCRFCGRVLNDGEVCGCQGQSAQQGYPQPQVQRPMAQQPQQRVARPQTQQQVHQQAQTQAQTQTQRQMTPQAQNQNFTQQSEQGWGVPFGGYQQDEGDLFDSPQQDWNIPFKSPEQGWGAPQQDNRGYAEQPFGQPLEQSFSQPAEQPFGQPFAQESQWGTPLDMQQSPFQQGASQFNIAQAPFQSGQPQNQFNHPFDQPVKPAKDTDELKKSAKGVLSYFSNMGETLKQAKESKGFLLPLIFSAMFVFVVIATTVLPKFISYGIEFNIFRTLIAAVVEAVLPVVVYILAKFAITKIFSKSTSAKDAFLGSVITFGYHALPATGVLLLNGVLSLIFPSISMVSRMLVFCYFAVTLIGDSRDGEPALTDKFSNVLIATLFLTAFLAVLYYACARLDSWSYSSSLSSLFNELFD